MATLSDAGKNGALSGLVKGEIFLAVVTVTQAVLGFVSAPFDAASGGQMQLSAPVVIDITTAGEMFGVFFVSGTTTLASVMSTGEVTLTGGTSLVVGQQVRVSEFILSIP